MENQEPVYVLSSQLNRVCEAVLARIYDKRQTDKENYVQARVDQYNAKVERSNRWRKKLGWLGFKPKMYITPLGMELEIAQEIDQMEDPEAQHAHQMIQIHRQYGGAEHEAKDCMIQCKLNETVVVSGDFIRTVSHLGLDFAAMTKKPPFGFTPKK